MSLNDYFENETKYSGKIYIRKYCATELSEKLSKIITPEMSYKNFSQFDKYTKASIYKLIYKELKKIQLQNNEFKEMISDNIDNEGMIIKFIIEIYDREGFLERYCNNNQYPLFVLSRETNNEKIKGIAVYSSNEIYTVERKLC